MKKDCVGYGETKCRILTELYCAKENYQCKFFKTPAQAKKDRENAKKWNNERGIITRFNSTEY